MGNQDLSKKILDDGELKLSELEKENAIKKEEHFRKLYHDIFEFNSTKDFYELCNMLVTGYYCMITAYKDKPEIKGDIEYIIKFAFRDFFLLMFINMHNVFDNDEFLKAIHKKAYFANNYVDLKMFEELIQYCKEQITKHEAK